MTDQGRPSAAESELVRRRIVTRGVPFVIALHALLFLFGRSRGVGLPIALTLTVVSFAASLLVLRQFSRHLTKEAESGDWTVNGEGPIA